MAEAWTFPQLLRRNGAQHGPEAAVVTEDGSMTHLQLDAASRALAARLVAAGVGKSARVGLCLPSGIDWAVAAAAVMRVGAALVPLEPHLAPCELEARLGVAGVTDLILAPSGPGPSHPDGPGVAPDVVEAVRAGRRHPQLPFLRQVWAVDDLPTSSVSDALVTALEDAVCPADDLAVLFSPGSPDPPKGVIHTHGGGLRTVASGLAARCIGAGDRVHIPAPFFSMAGFSGGLLSILVAGATLVTAAVPEPNRTVYCVERAPAPGARAKLLEMTETFGAYCGERLDVDLPEDKWGRCGWPFDGFEVRVVETGSGTTCAPGEVGEIRVRGRNMMRGICGRTRESTFDTDGFYPTGNLGSLDAAGYVWYHGRLDDTSAGPHAETREGIGT